MNFATSQSIDILAVAQASMVNRFGSINFPPRTFVKLHVES